MNIQKSIWKNTILACWSIIMFISFISTTKGQSNINNNIPKKIHLINILDYLSSSSTEQEGYAMRQASRYLGASFEAKLNKLSNDLPQTEVVTYNIFDNVDLEAEEASHNYYTDIEKNKFSKANLIKELQNISCKGDIVMVVYNGHGFSTSAKEGKRDNNGTTVDYPNLVLNYSPPRKDNHFVPYEDILCVLQEKQPAMIISLISTCQIEFDPIVEERIAINYEAYNQEFLTHFDRASVQEIYRNNEEAIQEARVNDLFNLSSNSHYNFLQQDQVLSVELLSCSKGEYTWVDTEGGHFLTSFIDVFSEGLKSSSSVTWEQIAANTQHKTEKRINAYNIYESTKGGDFEKHEQTPQCQVLVKDINCQNIPRSLPLPTIKEGITSTPAVIAPSFFEYEAHIQGRRKTPYWLAKRFVKLGESYRVAGSIEQAIRTLETAIPVLKANKNTYELATAYEKLGLAYQNKQDKNNALLYLNKAKKLFDIMKVEGSMDVINSLIEQVK